MARILRNLKIDEISAVDVGAGRGVKIMLTKRAVPQHADGTSTLYDKPLEFGAEIEDEATEYLKRDFSDDKRKEMAGKGTALPDGSYPIENKEDLGNAIQAIGRAKDPAKAKAHIKARAKALDAEDMLPDSWSKRLTKADVELVAERNVFAKVCKAAQDFDGMAGAMDTAEDASELMCAVREAMCALDCSIQSILCDEDVTDKIPSITTSFQQFKDHIGGLGLEDDADEDDTNKRNDIMSNPAFSPAVQKAMDEAVAKAVAAANSANEEKINKLLDDLTISKMSDAQKTYHDNLGSDTDKKKFRDMSADARDNEMDKTKKRLSDDPIVKGLMAENTELKKRLDAMDDERDLKIAKQDAKDLGLTQTDAGDVLMKMRRGDREAIKKYEGYVAELAKAKRAFEKSSRAFDELGVTGSKESDGTSAMDAITAMAKALREKDPNLTEAQAFDKAYNDPANKELRKQEADARMTKIHGRSFAA